MPSNYSGYRFKDGRWKRKPRLNEMACSFAVFGLCIAAAAFLWLGRGDAEAAVAPKQLPEAADAGCIRTATSTWDCTPPEMRERVKGVVWYDPAKAKAAAEAAGWKAKYPYAKPGAVEAVLDAARKLGYADVATLMRVIDCESKFDPARKNVAGNVPAGSTDRGLAQFNDYWKGHVSDACAYDAKCAAEAFVKEMRAGRANHWVCYNKLFAKK